LEILLVDEDAIKILSLVLSAFPAWDPCWGTPPTWDEPDASLTADDVQAVLDRKWLNLSDEVIAGLILSPTTLSRLQKTICDDLPLAWWDQLEAGADRFLERHSRLQEPE